MTKSRFEKISDFFNSHERLFFLLRIIYNYLPLAVMVSYPALLIYLFVSGNKADFIKALVVPAVTFAAATLFRAVINSQRPYEKLGIKHLIASNVDPSTGKYIGENCHGKEKVRRFREEFGEAQIDAFYSDSHSDDPMAETAKKAFLIKGEEILDWE